VLAGGLALVVLVGGFVYVLSRLGRSPGVKERPEETAAEVQARIDAGRRALADGFFQKALRELDAARAAHERRPDLLPAGEARRVALLQRQASLLSALLGKSLQEILQEAALVRADEEWQARFKQDYLHKAVLFDDWLRRDAQGRPVLQFYTVRVGGHTARLALEDVKLLRDLPLEPPRRLVFGARLAAVEREPGGGWAVRFEPDSGVLLTDRDAAAGCYPGPLDEELIAVLQRQAEWAGH
jgi:hypothetical protein